MVVEPGLVHDVAGNTNTGADLPLKYRPADKRLDHVYDVTTATVVATSGASFGVGLGVSHVVPSSAALGGVSGLFMIWQTQKFVMKKNMAVPYLPWIYRCARARLAQAGLGLAAGANGWRAGWCACWMVYRHRCWLLPSSQAYLLMLDVPWLRPCLLACMLARLCSLLACPRARVPACVLAHLSV